MKKKIDTQDKEIFRELWNEFYSSEGVLHPVDSSCFENTFSELLRYKDYFQGFLLMHEDRIAGYTLFAMTFSPEVGGKVLWIEDLYIKPAFQGKGIARNLLLEVKDEYQNKVKRIRLEAVHTNDRAIKLYEKVGYKKLDYLSMTIDF